MMIRVLALAGLLASLGACSGIPNPVYSPDAFKGIYNQTSAGVPANAPVTVTAPVGVIFSENVETYMGYIKDNTAYWGERVPASLTNTVAVADNDPIYFAGRTLQLLKNRFPTATKIHDFNEAVSTGKKSVILVDMKYNPMQPHGDRTTRVEIDFYFFNSAMNPVSKISGQGSYRTSVGTFEMGVQKSIDQALAEIQAKMAQVVR
jgi:hypothetical protein